jgi:predicted nucleic acid-binding protein
MLVVDANVAVRACGGRSGFELLRDPVLVAPPLLWSEFTSVVHEAAWRRQITAERAQRLRQALGASPLTVREHPRLHDEAWRIADELGFARTYDAEYVALAELLGCRLVTLDRRLRRGADKLGSVITPAEL